MIGSMSGVQGRTPIQGAGSTASPSGKMLRAIGSARASWTGDGWAAPRANSAPVVRRMPCRIGASKKPFDATGREFMSYIAQHGTFFDVPVKFLIGEMTRIYPKLCQPGGMRGSMEAEGAKR